MNSILNKLNNEQIWMEYLNNKLEKGYLTKKEKSEWDEYITNKKYLEVVDNILEGKGLGIPEKRLINKIR